MIDKWKGELKVSNIHSFLLCFSILQRESLESVINEWVPFVKRLGGNAQRIVLVGTRGDGRKVVRSHITNSTKKREFGESGIELVGSDQVKRALKVLKGVKYCECSAKTGVGVKNAFDEGIITALSSIGKKLHRKKKTSIGSPRFIGSARESWDHVVLIRDSATLPARTVASKAIPISSPVSKQKPTRPRSTSLPEREKGREMGVFVIGF